MSNAIHRWAVEIEAYGLERRHVAAIVESTTNDVCSVRDDYGTSSALDWSVAHDGSIKRDLEFELRTPALYGEDEAWDKLRAVCAGLRNAGAKVGITCGLHVHHDAAHIMKAARVLGRPQYATTEGLFTVTRLLYARMEEVLDTLMPASRRCNNNAFCMSVLSLIPAMWRSQRCTLDDPVGLRVREDHHNKVSAYTSLVRHNTIEYRQHSGTLNASKIIAWVKLTGLIHHKIADIICYNQPLPDKISTLEELMDYLDVERPLRKYLVNRQAALTTASAHQLSTCGCRTCKHNRRWVLQLLDYWAATIPSGTRIGWRPFTKETAEAILGVWTSSVLHRLDGQQMPRSCDEVAGLLYDATACAILVERSTEVCTTSARRPSYKSYIESNPHDAELLVVGDDGADFHSHKAAPYVAATKAGCHVKYAEAPAPTIGLIHDRIRLADAPDDEVTAPTLAPHFWGEGLTLQDYRREHE